MKKFTIVALIAFVSFLASGQKKVTDYHNDYFEKDYDIEAILDKNKTDFKIYIEVEGEAKKNYFSLSSKELPAFLSALKLVKEKYMDWCKVAIDNNVTDMNKDMGITFPTMNAAWLGTKYFFNFGFRPSFNFIILNNGDKYVASCYKKLVSSSNRYIDNKFYLAFGSEADFDSLIKALDENEIRNKLSSQNSKEDLFK